MTLTTEQNALLAAKLDRTVIKGRKQAGREVSYLEGWHVIDEANRIFGFGGWERHTLYCMEVSRQERGIGSPPKPGFKVGYEAKVRIVAGGVVRDGTGHGSGIATDLFDAIESAAKEAETDAMKRAFVTFGNQFGLALYDKTQEGVAEPEPPPRKPAATATNGAAPAPVKVLSELDKALAAIEANSASSDTLTAWHEKVKPRLDKLSPEHNGEFYRVFDHVLAKLMGQQDILEGTH